MTPGTFRSTGLAAVAVLWCTLSAAAVVSGFPVLGDRPLSWMVADPRSSPLFRGGLIVGALLLVAFHRDVRALHPVGRGFSVAMLGGLAGQVVAALVPIDGGPVAHQVHTAAALLLGASLPVLMWRFAAAQPAGGWRRIAVGLAWAEIAACAAGILLSRASVAPLAEILPAAAFHLWIIAVTLSGARRREVPVGDDALWPHSMSC